MYNYIDEVPQTIQDRVDQMTEDWNWYQEDYFEDASEILDGMTPSGAEYWRDYVNAQAEAQEKLEMFCDEMHITPDDLQAMVDYYDSLADRIEQDELDILYEQEWVEELAWYRHARQMGWE